MPQLRTKQQLVDLARVVVAAMSLATYKGNLYEARDFETGEPLPSPDRAVWLALHDDDLLDIAATLDTLFSTPAEFYSFKYMLRQLADRKKTAEPHVVIRHGEGLAYMSDAGLVKVEKPAFSPNFINNRIIEKEEEDYKYVTELFETIAEWLGSEDQARSLLHHLATALQPGWSAVKYVLLLGSGRNGKGTLLKMVLKLFGKRNISKVFRQEMAARRATVAQLNGKLLNLVFDGPASYVADSGPEKTLVAGEPIDIELKYENTPIEVETNALFMEALNKEPKNRDKSPALQARLVRFEFPNKYEDDLLFLEKMLSDFMINALLTLLWEHWVKAEDLSTKLRASESSLDLQVANELNNSPVLAFIEDTSRKDPEFITALRSEEYSADAFADSFEPWLQSKHYGERSTSSIWEHMAEHFKIERKVKREKGRPVTRRYIIGVLPDTARALRTMEGGIQDDEAVVRDE